MMEIKQRRMTWRALVRDLSVPSLVAELLEHGVVIVTVEGKDVFEISLCDKLEVVLCDKLDKGCVTSKDASKGEVRCVTS